MSTTQSNLSLRGTLRKENGRLMDAWWQEMMDAEAAGKPVCNTFVMGSISEIMTTFGITQNLPEISSLQTAFKQKSMEYLLAAEDAGYSPDICGYVKVDVGVHMNGGEHPNGRLPKPSLVVSSNQCNTYIKWSEIWEQLFGCPVKVFDIPGVRGSRWELGKRDKAFENDRKYVEVQLRELIRTCEEITGTKFDIDKLRDVMGEVNKMSDYYRQILELNKNRPAPFSAMKEGISFMGIANVYRGRPEGTEFMRIALEELKERVANGVGNIPDEKFRLLFIGVACYSQFRRFLQLFEEWGGTFIHSEYMTFGAGGVDRGVDYDLSKPIESLAERILLTAQQSMSGIFFSQDWQAKVVEEWGADGIVFHGVKSCRTVSAGLADEREYQVTNNATPSLLIESDLVDARLWSEAQMKNRIDAYFEALASKKAQGR